MKNSIFPVQNIRLLIVDDHRIVRDGIKAMLLSQKPAFHFLIEEAESGETAIQKVLRREFDIILLDYCLPGMTGAETAEQIRMYREAIKILAISNYEEYSYIDKMMRAGVKSYILKNIEPGQLVQAIRLTLEGKAYFSPEIAIKLLEQSYSVDWNQKGKPLLSRRETEILNLLAKGLTNREIASRLYLSKRTVDTHRQNMLIKLHADNSIGLIMAAIKLGLLSQL